MSKYLILFLKITVSLAALGYVVYKLQAEGAGIWLQIGNFEAKDIVFTFICVLLLVVNQGLEAKKWQILLQKLYPDLHFYTAIRAILAGNTAGIFTPNRIGEYAGRVFYLPEGKRVEAAALTLVDRFFQMLVTLWLGWGAAWLMIYFFLTKIQSLFPFSASLLHLAMICMGLACLLMSFLFIFPHKMVAWASRQTFFHRWKMIEKSLFALSQVPSQTLAKVFLLSLLRNLTFSLQYYLLMLAFGYEESVFLGFMLIWLIYVIKSVIPSISLAELGIRESVALAIMQLFDIGALTAVSSTFLLYLINIAFPAIIGVFFMQKK